MSDRRTAGRRRGDRPRTIVVYGVDRADKERLVRRLQAGGAEVSIAGSLRRAVQLAAARPDLVAVAWDGDPARLKLVDLLHEARSPVPILVALSQPTVEACVRALNAGADVCVVSYLDEEELAAQCAALVRRARSSSKTRPFGGGPLVVEATAPVATVNGREVRLTSGEHFILKRLADRLGDVVPRNDLSLYGGRTTDSSLESSISRLRAKLPGFDLRAVRDQGYVLRPPAKRG